MADKDIDLKKSKLVIEIKDQEVKAWEKRISEDLNGAAEDKNQRKRIYEKRRSFILGEHEKYTNINGLTKRQKKGHADQVINFVGKSAEKIYYAIANNPPKVKILPCSRTDEIEDINAQIVEDFVDRVFWHNKWWKQGYKRAVMNQVSVADFAVKVYFDSEKKEIKVVQAEKMENIRVGWRSDDALEYDWVAHTERVSVRWIKDNWGIDAPVDYAPKSQNVSGGEHGDEWSTGSQTTAQGSDTPKDVPVQNMANVTEFTTDKYYIILINDKIVEFVEHKWGFNPWVIGHSLHIPGRPWSKSFVDDLMSPNVELNEVMNDDRDFIRTASNAKYVAKNMPDFDPESIKTGSGQVIFVDGPDSDFSTLDQRVNTYPVDTYIQKVKSFIHDLGVPEVAFGTGGGDSGRAKAIDYQTIVDVADNMRDAWELVLDGVISRIQILGNLYFPGEYWANPETSQFEVRMIEYDWSEVVPITQSDKIVDVLNKFQMGLPFKLALQELGYKDVEAVIELMKQEQRDPELSALRAKMYNVMQGIIEATKKAQAAQSEVPGATPTGAPATNTPSPTLVNSQNGGRESSLPMSASTGTSFSSPNGFIDMVRQNLAAGGR